MNVDPKAGIVRKVPARMIGVVVDDDVIGVPQPAVDIVYVPGRDRPVPVVEIEAAWIASAEPPNVVRPEATRPAAVLPWMVHVIVGVVAAGVMPNPYFAFINMRRIGMVGLITVIAALVAVIVVALIRCILMIVVALRRLLVIVSVIGRGSARRRWMLSAILTAVAVVVPILGKCRHSHNQ